MLIEIQNTNPETSSQTEERQVFTPYRGREMVDRMMTGMMQEMQQGTERTGRRRIQAVADTMRGMGCDSEEIRNRLMKEFGVSSEEAERYL